MAEQKAWACREVFMDELSDELAARLQTAQVEAIEAAQDVGERLAGQRGRHRCFGRGTFKYPNPWADRHALLTADNFVPRRGNEASSGRIAPCNHLDLRPH